MIYVKNVLVVIAFILLLMEAIGVKYTRVTLGWLGLACWALSYLVV